MSLTKASYSMIQGAPVNVFDYMTEAQRQDVASGTGALNVTAALNQALADAIAIPFSEKELVFPAGLYRITQFDFTGVQRCTFTAQGAVQIYGNGVADFIFGCDGYVASATPDVDSTFTQNCNFTGGIWSIGNTGGTYTHNVKITAANGCKFNNFSISGSCGVVSGANRISAAINFSWVNRFINFNVGSPGVPGVGFRSFCIAVGPLSGNNVNNNLFESCRIQAGAVSPPYADQVGISIPGGNANAIKTCDISALDVGIEFVNTRGTVCDGNYHEFVKTIVDMPSGNSRGNTFIGGIHEILTNGEAYRLTSSQNTVIVGGRYFGVSGGSNRTFINQGSACFGLSVVSPDLENIDNNLTGTYKGASTVSGSRILQAQWLSFPPAQIVSTDPNTLDDYEEGTWTPNQGAGLTVVGAFSSFGTYTKIGRLVTVIGHVSGATSIAVASGGIMCSNVPFTSANYCLGTATDNAANNGISLYMSVTTLYAANAIPAATDRINFGATFFV